MTPREIGRVASEAVLQAVWRQWAVIGAGISRVSVRPSRTIIDPEALLLTTLAVRDSERRLDDVLGWFAETGVTFISVKRFNALARSYSRTVSAGANAFASLAVESGDHRWKRLAQSGDETIVTRRKAMGEIDLSSPAALMFRLRAGFGVGVKPDAIAYLLGMRGRPATVKDIAVATAYTPQAVRKAVHELRKAGILFKTVNRPVAFLMNPKPWDEIFKTTATEEGEFVRWHYIGQLFAMLSQVIDWAHTEAEARSSTYMASSHARDIYEGSTGILRLNGIDVPDASGFPGEEFLPVFGMAVRRIAEWLD